MCGRYLLDSNDINLKKFFSNIGPSSGPEYNFKTGEIFPTNTVPIISPKGIILGKWGFPRGDKKGIVINARVETLRDRVMFKGLVDSNRCIVPASAYFEWNKGRYIIEKKNSILYMAGLYNNFSERSQQLSLLEEISSGQYLAFTIITKEANKSLSKIHPRMPLILSKEEGESWLRGEHISNLELYDEDYISYSIYETRI